MKVQLEVSGSLPSRADVVDLPCIPRVGEPVRYGGTERSVRHVIWVADFDEPWARLILNPNDDDLQDSE